MRDRSCRPLAGFVTGASVRDALSAAVFASPSWLASASATASATSPAAAAMLGCADLDPSSRVLLSEPTSPPDAPSSLGLSSSSPGGRSAPLALAGGFTLTSWGAAAGLLVNGSAVQGLGRGGRLTVDVAVTLMLAAPGGGKAWPPGAIPTGASVQFDVFRTSCSLLGIVGYIVGSADNTNSDSDSGAAADNLVALAAPAPAAPGAAPPLPGGAGFNASGVVAAGPGVGDGGGGVDNAQGTVVCVAKTLTVSTANFTEVCRFCRAKEVEEEERPREREEGKEGRPRPTSLFYLSHSI